MKQIKEVVKIVDYKFPRDAGWKIVQIFDHSSSHSAIPDDALVVSKMNVSPSGKQCVMRDGQQGGMPEQMYFNLGKIPKGMQQLLEGRGVNTWNEGREGERSFRKSSEL